MANRFAGEVALTLDGQVYDCKLTLGALAELEEDLGACSLVDLIARFEGGHFSAGDILSLVTAGLRGGGWSGVKSDLVAAQIDGGPAEAARVAARLLVAAFDPFGA